MKKFLLFIFVLSAIRLEAQSWVYHPFPTDSAIWCNRLGTINPPNDFNVYWHAPVYYCMGNTDTIIGSVTYSKIDSCGGAYHGALRDDNGKVYYIPSDSLNELLIYDFTAHTGNTVSVYNLLSGQNSFQKFTYQIGVIDSVFINGSYRKRIQVETAYWIEGIGNTNGLFTESWPNVSNYVIELACMSEKNITLYPSFSLGACSFSLGVNEQENKRSLIIFPNPTTGLFSMTISGITTNMVDITDVLGNSILKTEVKNGTIEMDLIDHPSGIYFVRISDPAGNFVVKKIIKE